MDLTLGFVIFGISISFYSFVIVHSQILDVNVNVEPFTSPAFPFDSSSPPPPPPPPPPTTSLEFESPPPPPPPPSLAFLLSPPFTGFDYLPPLPSMEFGSPPPPYTPLGFDSPPPIESPPSPSRPPPPTTTPPASPPHQQVSPTLNQNNEHNVEKSHPHPHHHDLHHDHHHQIHLPPPSPPPVRRLNAGKKVGLLFIGVAAIMQIGMVGFLVYKRRQLLKTNDMYETHA